MFAFLVLLSRVFLHSVVGVCYLGLLAYRETRCVPDQVAVFSPVARARAPHEQRPRTQQRPRTVGVIGLSSLPRCANGHRHHAHTDDDEEEEEQAAPRKEPGRTRFPAPTID